MLEKIKERYPGVMTSTFDLREPFPFDTAIADVVIASLCLHFFEESEMRGILAEIRRVLKKNGKYMTSEGLKQFYNEDIIRDVFREWDITSVEEYETEKFSRRKAVFEMLIEPHP